MRTTTIERPGIHTPAMPNAITAPPKTRLVGRWLPDRKSPSKMTLVWMTEPV